MFLYHTLPHVRNCNLKTEQPLTLFGAAQQSVTGFIDKRVNGLLGEMPEADSSKKPATAKPPARATGAS